MPLAENAEPPAIASRRVLSRLASLFGCGADHRVFAKIDAQLRNQGLQVVQMRTRRAMVVVFRDAGRELDDDSALLDPLPLVDLLDEIAQLAVQSPSAAASACQMEGPIRSVFGVVGESTRTFVKCFLAEVAGTTLLDQVALNDSNVILVLHGDDFFWWDGRVMERSHSILHLGRITTITHCIEQEDESCVVLLTYWPSH